MRFHNFTKVLCVILWSFIVCSTLYCKEPPVKKLLGQDIFDHKIPGCPENSICSKQMGDHRLAWLKVVKRTKKLKDLGILRKYYQRSGLPVSYWMDGGPAVKDFSPISWESSCTYHKKKGQNIYEGMAFIKGSRGVHLAYQGKKITKLALGAKFFLTPHLLYNFERKKVTLYWLPKGDAPSYIDGDSLFIVRDADELFYGLRIHGDGRWQIVDSSSKETLHFERIKEDIKCPDALSDYKFSKKNSALIAKLFRGYYCQTIWDKKAKKNRIVRKFWGCN